MSNADNELSVLKSDLVRAEANHFNATISDNFYYTSGKHKRAKEEIKALKEKITHLEKKVEV